jgi:hypothetical protein
MPLLHKLQNIQFENGFKTHNSILDTVSYAPEVLFIGTHNHGWIWNKADFYYGRDMYMWTSLANLFLYNRNRLTKKRNAVNNIPSLHEIFDICVKGKLVFADIVKGIRESIPAIEYPQDKTVMVNEQYSWKSYKDTPIDFMGAKGWLEDNGQAIVRFINETPTIKHVYFTFKSGKWLVEKKKEICNQLRYDVTSCSIFTPTANGFGNVLKQPFRERAWSLTHCWVWNGLNHGVYVNKPDYGHLDHEWLIANCVTPDQF